MAPVFRIPVIIICCCTLFQVALFSQNDSIVMVDGQVLVGEIKGLDKSVLTIETAFSNSDFTVKWKEISEVYVKSSFLITLTDGLWITSDIQTNSPKRLVLNDNGIPREVDIADIVYMKPLESGLWSRLEASADVGLNVTRANHLKQINFAARLGYLAEHFSTQMYYQDNRSIQDSVAPTRRNEGGINYRYFLKNDWYILPQITFLSNTEQALKSRLSPNIGAGRFLVRDNRMYWGVFGGVSYNRETFTNETPERNSAELYAGTEFNLFDFGDLDLLTNIAVYPSLTETNRVRADFKFDSRYEFVNDFYLKFNITLNYDNQPAIAGNDTDYVFGISIGWSK